jgi:glutamate synthase (NADPH/NADH) small chain
MACAQQLARAGHTVTVFEKNDRIGGLMRYGIPDFKMEKHLINRRAVQMETEGVEFRTSMEVGVQVSFESLQQNYDAVVMSGGAEEARRLEIPGAELAGVRLAMEFLTQQNKRNAGDDEVRAAPRGTLTATGKHVLVIGGGDTGSDCVGTSNRQGAASVTQIEIMPKPPTKEDKALNWPDWPMKLRTSSSHEEGCDRDWAVLTKRVVGTNGNVEGLECVRVEWVDGKMVEMEGSEFTLKADLILLAMGFTGPRKPGLVEQAEVSLDGRGNVAADTENYETSRDGVFACGDMRRGQSLVVWAIREGRQCARAVDLYLTGKTELPR